MKTKKITVIRVKVGEAPEVIEIEKSLQSYYKALDCEMIEAIYPFEDNLALVCDEEGKINGSKPNRAVVVADESGIGCRIYDYIYGNFMIVGLSRDDFASVPKRLVDKRLKRITPNMVYCND